MLAVASAGPVPDQFHPANHLADGEEPNGLRGDNADIDELLIVHIPHGVHDVRGTQNAASLIGDLGGCTNGIHHGLEMRLESRNITCIC